MDFFYDLKGKKLVFVSVMGKGDPEIGSGRVEVRPLESGMGFVVCVGNYRTEYAFWTSEPKYTFEKTEKGAIIVRFRIQDGSGTFVRHVYQVV